MNKKAKHYIMGILIVWLMLVFVSAIWNVSQIEKNQFQTYLENARSLFNLIVTTREWNAQQGGVYLPVTDQIQPNPYLDMPNRDVTTTSGQNLTLVNPAYMTRLIGELADRKNNVKFHLTSLNPIRPLNAPEKWESNALQLFENGVLKEYFGYNGEGKSTVFRYMAPLITEQSCLKCHEKQGYKAGDIRGGISITFPVNLKTPWALIVSHILIALIVSPLIFLFGRKLNQTMQTLEDLSNIDGLTQIRNRRYFDETLNREFLYSKRNKVPLSLAICDIDDFKSFNDEYGHQAGDDCLKLVAQTLNGILKRPGDVVSRYGGEEFGIILPNTNKSDVMVIGSLLHTKIESLNIPHKSSKIGPYLTISIGVATYYGNEMSKDGFLHNADQALYKAKAGGKNFASSLDTEEIDDGTKE